MKLSTHLSLVSLLLLSSAAAQADCVYTQAPKSLPNGATATKEEMLAAQASVKEYTRSVQEVYLPCLEQEKNESLLALDAADPELAAKQAAIANHHAKKHNAALDELQATADRWNSERRAFTDKDKK